MTAIRSWPSTGCTEARHGSLILACSTCANTHKWQRIMPPEVVTRWASQNGWQIDAKFKRSVCDRCVAALREKESEARMTNEAKKSVRAVWTLLEEHYDDDAKRYEHGWTDARVAAEAGMAEAYVAGIRSEHFGPTEDPRVVELRADIERASAESSKAFAELAELVRAEHDRHAKEMAALAQRAARLRL